MAIRLRSLDKGEMMIGKRNKLSIMLSVLLICTATPLCHAQDLGTLLDVKTRQAKVSSVSVQESIIAPPPRPIQVNAAKETSEKSWYRRFLEGFVAVILGAKAKSDARSSSGLPNSNEGRPV